MKFELSQSFYFEAAHTLQRHIEVEGSKRIHGHTYHAEVTVTGTPNPDTGMILDIGFFKQEIDSVRQLLDHHFLDEVPNLGPATLENLCTFIHNNLSNRLPGLTQITVERRTSGDRCTLKL